MALRRLTIVLLAVAVIAAWARADDGFRTFRDKTGKYEVEAKFVEFRNSKAVLKRRDGSSLKVSLSQLSESDRTFVRKQINARRDRSEGTSSDRRVSKNAAPDRSAANQAGAQTDWRGPNRDGVIQARRW